MARRRGNALVRLTAVACILALGTAIAAFQGIVPPEFALIGMGLFFACLLGVVALAWKNRREALEFREQAGRGQALVLLAAQLRDEDPARLEEMSRRGGLVGEAAALILQGRAERKQR